MTMVEDQVRDLDLKILGNVKERPAHPEDAVLETIPNLWPEADYEVKLVFEEFSSVCPVTSRAGFGTIEINYLPRKKLIESESLVFYLSSYRNYGCFQEFAVNKICNDLGTLLEPRSLQVKGLFRPRGSLAIQPIARYKP